MDRIGTDIHSKVYLYFYLINIRGFSGTFSLSVTTKISIQDKASLKQMEAHPSVWLLKRDSILFSMRAI